MLRLWIDPDGTAIMPEMLSSHEPSCDCRAQLARQGSEDDVGSAGAAAERHVRSAGTSQHWEGLGVIPIKFQ